MEKKVFKEKLLVIIAKLILNWHKIWSPVFFGSFLVVTLAYLIFMLVTQFTQTIIGISGAFGFVAILFGGMYLVYKIQTWAERVREKNSYTNRKFESLG